MLTHHNIVSNIKSTDRGNYFGLMNGDRTLSFLPLCHIYERTTIYVYLFYRASTYYAESMETIADNIREVQPTMFTSVPRLLEKIYDKIMAKGNELTGIKRTLFFGAIEFGLSYDPMKKLGLIQFFSWFALFTMWVYTTPAIAHHVFKLPIEDTNSDTFRSAQTWTGIIFGVYNAVSAIYALLLPRIAKFFGKKKTHAFSLIAGGLGLLSMYFADNKYELLLAMVGVGFAWASILSMPYAILAGKIPSGKMGVYMGIFNFFITIPQIINGIVGGPIVKYFYNNNAIYAIVLAGVFMLCAAISVLYVSDDTDSQAALSN